MNLNGVAKSETKSSGNTTCVEIEGSDKNWRNIKSPEMVQVKREGGKLQNRKVRFDGKVETNPTNNSTDSPIV